MPDVVFTFADGETLRCPVPPGQAILDAARAAGITLAAECENGDCQTCKGTLRCGAVDVLEETSLTPADIAAGAVLPCVSAALGEVEIALPYCRADVIAPGEHEMQITAVERLTPTTMLLRGELPRRSRFRFLPGQYVNLTLPDGSATRSYSMASSPSDPRRLEFHIRLTPGGRMAEFLAHHAHAGQALGCAGPYGTFYLRETGAPAMMIAGGTGLAPMMAMLRALAERNSTQPIALYYGMSRMEDIYGLAELEALKPRLPGLSVDCAVLAPDGGWQGHAGYVTDMLSPAALSAAAQIYVCGPQAMMDAARTRIRQGAAQNPSVYFEDFSPAARA